MEGGGGGQAGGDRGGRDIVLLFTVLQANN